MKRKELVNFLTNILLIFSLVTTIKCSISRKKGVKMKIINKLYSLYFDDLEFEAIKQIIAKIRKEKRETNKLIKVFSDIQTQMDVEALERANKRLNELNDNLTHLTSNFDKLSIDFIKELRVIVSLYYNQIESDYKLRDITYFLDKLIYEGQ